MKMGEIIGEAVYVLCAIMSIICSFALLRGYRASGNKLLFWSGLCFVFLAINNIFLCFDLIVFSTLDLHGPFWRSLLSTIAGALLLYGLIGEIA